MTWARQLDAAIVLVPGLVGAALALFMNSLAPVGEAMPGWLEIFGHNMLISIVVILAGIYVARLAIGFNSFVAGMGATLFARSEGLTQTVSVGLHIPFEVAGWFWTLAMAHISTQFYRRRGVGCRYSSASFSLLGALGIVLYLSAAIVEATFRGQL